MRIFAVGTKILGGGAGQHLGGPVPPGPNVEPPLPGSTLFQTSHHRRPSFSGCRLTVTDLELTTRHKRFGINTAVVPAPIENFFLINDPLFNSTVIVVSQ